MLKDLKRGLLKYENIEKFLANIRKEFEKDEKSVKVVELKRLE